MTSITFDFMSTVQDISPGTSDSITCHSEDWPETNGNVIIDEFHKQDFPVQLPSFLETETGFHCARSDEFLRDCDDLIAIIVNPSMNDEIRIEPKSVVSVATNTEYDVTNCVTGRGRGRKRKRTEEYKSKATDPRRITAHTQKLQQEAAVRNLFYPDPKELSKLRGQRPHHTEGSLDEDWEDKFDLVLEYGRVKGTCNVPWLLVCEYPDGSQVKLGHWLHEQRQNKRKQRLRPDRHSRLQELANQGKFSWTVDGTKLSTFVTVDDDSWNQKFALLLKYGEEHKDCNVPWGFVSKLSDGTEVRLGYWLKDQRSNRKKGRLRDDRRDRLQALVDSGKLRWTKDAEVSVSVSVGVGRGTRRVCPPSQLLPPLLPGNAQLYSAPAVESSSFSCGRRTDVVRAGAHTQSDSDAYERAVNVNGEKQLDWKWVGEESGNNVDDPF